MDEAIALAQATKGVVEAPAGCGKTHLIAAAVSLEKERRQLILTHTHAGVDALRKKLRNLGVAASMYHVDTIAGWSLRIAASFPDTSGLATSKPVGREWDTVYRSAARLLSLRPYQEILRASYGGIFVDEYQDCSVVQHNLVLALVNLLPCRVLGDPLQGIFDFVRDTPAVQWDEHVTPFFDKLISPSVPWRWRDKNPRLGEWLLEVRDDLIEGREVNLEGAPLTWVQLSSTSPGPERRRVCYRSIGNRNDSVVAILKIDKQCHRFTRYLRGTFSCVEAIDCKDLLKAAKAIGSAKGKKRAVEVINFASNCMTQVPSLCKTIHTAYENDRAPTPRKDDGKRLLEAISPVTEDESPASILRALEYLKGLPDVVVSRRELLSEMKRSLREFSTGRHSTLEDAAWDARSRTRRIGRPMAQRCVATTLLVKGLEFDHAILLDADSLDSKNLYVALTRGSKSLTVISKSLVLKPE
jgi:DNA helicase-2/ATP-dependent DNA helicase PcrA